MEFDFHISKLQGALLSLNSRGLFQQSGETKSLETLKEIFSKVNDNDIKLKMVFFIILNTDLTVLKTSQSIEGLDHFICISPPLNHHRVLEFIWDLELQQYFCKVIENCNFCLTSQLIASFSKNDHLWSIRKKNYRKLCSVWCSVFLRIHNNYKGFGDKNECLTLAYYFEDISGNICELIKSVLSCKTESQIAIKAEHLINFFNSVLFMVRLFNDKNYKFEKETLFSLADNLGDKFAGGVDLGLLNPSESCLKILFLLMPSVMELVTVDLWLSLSDVPDENSTSHAQQVIGEIIYHICDEAKDLFPTLLDCLMTCKIKPKSESDKISEAGLDEIMKNVEMGKKFWFKGLIEYTSHSENKSPMTPLNSEKAIIVDGFENPKIIDCLTKHLHLADSDDVNLILSKCINILTSDQPNELVAKIKRLLKGILRRDQSETRFKLLRDIFIEKPFIGRKLETTEKDFSEDDINNGLTEIFNKISAEEDIEFGELACLCLDSREKTLSKLCQLALSNSKQMETCLRAMDALKEAFTSIRFDVVEETFLEFALKDILTAEDMEYPEDSIVSLFQELESLKVISWPYYLKLLDLLNAYLMKENYERVTLLLKLVQAGVKSSFPRKDTKVKLCLLVFLSQVTDRLTWDLENFLTCKADGLVAAGTLIVNLVAEMNDSDKGSHLRWAFESISRCSEITRSYFCDLWFKFGFEWSTLETLDLIFLSVAHGSPEIVDSGKLAMKLEERHSSDEIRRSIVLSLALILPRLTFPAWERIFSSLEEIQRRSTCLMNAGGNESSNGDVCVIDILSRSLYLITLELNKNMKISTCYEYCLRNFGLLVKKLPRRTTRRTENWEISVLEKIIFVLGEITDDQERETCYLTLSSLINDLIDSARATSNDQSCPEVDELLKVLNVKKAQDVVYLERIKREDQKSKKTLGCG